VIPDGLLFFSLLAAWEAARAGVLRSRWAVAGLVLGAGMTLAANTGAGLVHSPLDAAIDALVPVCFFIAVEIVLWHVRRGRGAGDTGRAPATSRRPVSSSSFEAAKLSMRETYEAGNPWSRNQLQARFGLSRAEATEVWQPYQSPAGAGATVSAGPKPPAGVAPIPQGAPTGWSPAPAGASNGRAHG
jgi:hypothetical protein